jgi:hypothetical protein
VLPVVVNAQMTAVSPVPALPVQAGAETAAVATSVNGLQLVRPAPLTDQVIPPVELRATQTTVPGAKLPQLGAE